MIYKWKPFFHGGLSPRTSLYLRSSTHSILSHHSLPNKAQFNQRGHNRRMIQFYKHKQKKNYKFVNSYFVCIVVVGDRISFFFNSTLSPKIKSIIKYSHAQSPLLYICFKLRNVAALIQNKRERFENIYKMQHTHAQKSRPKIPNQPHITAAAQPTAPCWISAITDRRQAGARRMRSYLGDTKLNVK